MPKDRQGRYRNIVYIGLLIGGVSGLTLLPAIYILLHAMQWTRALHIVEGAFLPLLCLSVAAGLFVYQRVKSPTREETSVPGDETIDTRT